MRERASGGGRRPIDHPVTFSESIETVGKTLEAVGVAVIVIGALLAAYQAWSEREGLGIDRYRRYRRRLGRAILLGLELLVAADIIRTVALNPTFTSVGVLAVLVLIRTFLSMSLEVELEGRWPWQPRREPSPGGP